MVVLQEVAAYLHTHLKWCAINPDTEEGRFAQFCQKSLARILENKNRKYPPSRAEVACVVKRQQIHSRFHFMDGEFRALPFDSASTTSEVVAMIKDRIGLPPSSQGFSLFEVFGALERNMLPWEKVCSRSRRCQRVKLVQVADAVFKWEKYAASTHSQKELKLTFKKRLFTAPFGIPEHPIEFDLIFHQVRSRGDALWLNDVQALDDVINDRFPLTPEEAVFLAALRAQAELNDFADSNIKGLCGRCRHGALRLVRRGSVHPHHRRLRPEAPASESDAGEAGAGAQEAQGPLHQGGQHGIPQVRAGVEAVRRHHLRSAGLCRHRLPASCHRACQQSYTTTLPKTLWLAVNEVGIHILRRREREPLISYPYHKIVNYRRVAVAWLWPHRNPLQPVAAQPYDCH